MPTTMDATTVVGTTLVTGLVLFLVGASGWRMAYEQPLPAALRVIADDHRRRSWIHLWMLLAMPVTSGGVAALALVVQDAAAQVWVVVAAVVYGLGAVCWMVSLVFRLTVTPWAAERTVADGRVPDVFRPLDAWAGWLYGTHMVSAYAAFGLLGIAMLTSGLVPHWAGWVGAVGGPAFAVGIIATRFAGPFNPPFWAHLYTGLLGFLLLV